MFKFVEMAQKVSQFIIYFSFLKKSAYGGITNYTTFTLKAYRDLFSSSDR